ncbi:MAG: hypothetical protein DMF94_27090 [Acidobacteria bacterium]|nr:MAG: hypothetical protein DMF94_27090 [Acidobacteriota bacterium]
MARWQICVLSIASATKQASFRAIGLWRSVCLRQILRLQPNSRTGRHVGALTAPNAATKVTKTRKHETRKTGKSIEHLEPVHHAQILNYMRVVRMRAGLLMNFNVALLAEGMRRKVL